MDEVPLESLAKRFPGSLIHRLEHLCLRFLQLQTLKQYPGKLGLSLSLYCCGIVLTKILMLYPDRAASWTGVGPSSRVYDNQCWLLDVLPRGDSLRISMETQKNLHDPYIRGRNHQHFLVETSQTLTWILNLSGQLSNRHRHC